MIIKAKAVFAAAAAQNYERENVSICTYAQKDDDDDDYDYIDLKEDSIETKGVFERVIVFLLASTRLFLLVGLLVVDFNLAGNLVKKMN